MDALRDSIPSLFRSFQEKLSEQAADWTLVMVSHFSRLIHLRLALSKNQNDSIGRAAQPQEIHSMLLSDLSNVSKENEAWAAYFTGTLTKDTVWLATSLELGKGVLLRLWVSDVLAEVHLQRGEADMAIARMRERVSLARSLGESMLRVPEWLAKAELAFALFHLCRFYVKFGRFKEAVGTCDELGALARPAYSRCSSEQGPGPKEHSDILVIGLHLRLFGHLATYMGDFKEAIQKNKIALDILLPIYQNMDPRQVPFGHTHGIKQCISHAFVELWEVGRTTGNYILEDRQMSLALENLLTRGEVIVPEVKLHLLESQFDSALRDKRLEDAEAIAGEMMVSALFHGLTSEICNALKAAAEVAAAWASMDERQETKNTCLQVAESFLEEALKLSSGDSRAHRVCLSGYGRILLSFSLYAQARQKLEESLLLFMQMERDPQTFGSFSRGRIAYLESVKYDFRTIQLALWFEEMVRVGLVWAERSRSRDLLYGISNSRHELLVGTQALPWVTSSEFDQDDAKAWSEIQSLCELEEDTVFLVYTQLESTTVLNYFLHAHEQTGLIARLDVNMDPVEVDIPSGKVSISRLLVWLMNEGPQRADSLLETLYDCFISKWSERLQRIKPKRLVIVAGEALALLPFAAFRDRDDEHTPYLIQKYEIVNVPSLRLFQYCKQRHEFLQHGRTGGVQRSAASGLVVGNPQCDLQYAQEEARHVAGILEECNFRTTVLEREDATKEAILEQLVACDWVHISSHGEFSDEGYPFGSLLTSSRTELVHPQEASSSGTSSGGRVLNLTPPSIIEASHARITGRAILQLKEDIKAKCVVLSACQTGQGASGAEGVLNLARDFHSAGVPAAVVSLWKVDDTSTCQLMKGLYKYLKDGKELSTALQSSMVDMINQTDDFEQSEYSALNWAPFLLSGDPSITLSL